MKNGISVFILTITILVFAFASISFSQSKETKAPDKTVKQEIHKKNDTQQIKKIQTAGKTIESKTKTGGKAGAAEFKGMNHSTTTAHLNKNEKEIKKIEQNKEHHKKYHNKSIIKNQSKENANKQKEKK